MPYTRPWDEVNFLLGARYAHEIDDASRETHVDLTERFSDIVEDVEADPWVPKAPALLGQVVTRYPWCAGHVETLTSTTLINATSNYIYPGSSSGTPGHLNIWMPVPVPIGFKLKWVVFRIKRETGATVVCQLHKTFPDALTAVLGTAPNPVGTGWENVLLEGAPVEDVPVSGTSLFAIVELENSGSNTARFMDMEVAYEPAPPPP